MHVSKWLSGDDFFEQIHDEEKKEMNKEKLIKVVSKAVDVQRISFLPFSPNMYQRCFKHTFFNSISVSRPTDEQIHSNIKIRKLVSFKAVHARRILRDDVNLPSRTKECPNQCPLKDISINGRLKIADSEATFTDILKQFSTVSRSICHRLIVGGKNL